MPHGGSSVRAVPGRVHLRKMGQNLAHGGVVQRLSNHDGGSASPHCQHGSHPANLEVTSVTLKVIPSLIKDTCRWVCLHGNVRLSGAA